MGDQESDRVLPMNENEIPQTKEKFLVSAHTLREANEIIRKQGLSVFQCWFVPLNDPETRAKWLDRRTVSDPKFLLGEWTEGEKVCLLTKAVMALALFLICSLPAYSQKHFVRTEAIERGGLLQLAKQPLKPIGWLLYHERAVTQLQDVETGRVYKLGTDKQTVEFFDQQLKEMRAERESEDESCLQGVRQSRQR